ncbi:MAG: S8 family serine peptidase, partial [Chloroflexia bacterium]
MKGARLALVLVVAMGLMGPVSALRVDAAPKAQPALLRTVAEHPDAKVAVIVQKATRDDSAEQAVAALGGMVTRDLRIINAFAARMPAKAVSRLAADNSVRWVSLDAPVAKASEGCDLCVDTSHLTNAYDRAVGADRVWNSAPYLQGQGVTVAVVDSGVSSAHRDLQDGSGASRVVAQVRLSTTPMTTTQTVNDLYGHGSHVAGIIGGNGDRSSQKYMGIAPRVNLVNVKVGDDLGGVNTSDVVAGLQWVYDNRTIYNIRVVNLSLTATEVESYNTSPLDAAVEILWFSRVVVVVAAGNNGTGLGPVAIFPPANDPFAITVGATNDMGTASTSDDTLASFSAYGLTEAGVAKPDLVAPGVNIISTLAGRSDRLAQLHANHVVDNDYFRMSGTSMAAPVVAGAVALLLQDEPTLNPDQVKYRLVSTARPLGVLSTGGSYLDIYAAVTGSSTATANTGIPASQLLW